MIIKYYLIIIFSSSFISVFGMANNMIAPSIGPYQKAIENGNLDNLQELFDLDKKTFNGLLPNLIRISSAQIQKHDENNYVFKAVGTMGISFLAMTSFLITSNISIDPVAIIGTGITGLSLVSVYQFNSKKSLKQTQIHNYLHDLSKVSHLKIVNNIGIKNKRQIVE